ncbi:TonB-dependent copper receptor [Pseudoalteromonas xiamenensis]|uniref:TonB-dependent copper receptor n=1 Tax=Pseudoalteromonas xiamenensis TaxID=882626 RepID=UPI0027E5B61F|nr:TonB-dependent copper receptor [Pseudoalteromonas xiamenensis]WMN60520.1 TonB-dependent copper receptor [Pseudoalteromonas xiamenensis]
MKRSLLTTAVLASFAASVTADELEKIVVIAPMQTPLTISTDPKLPRQPMPAQDGADLLSSIAGFSLVKKGAASGDPVFRGMAGSRLNIVTDAGSTLGGCGSRMDPPTAYITPQSFDTLTVIKGPQTVLYGPGNSAATVVFSRDNERMEEAGVSGFMNSVVGSFGRKGINTDIKVGNETYFTRLTGSYQESDDYKDGNGDDVHSAYDKWNMDAEFAYTPTDNEFVIVSVGKSDGNVAYGDRLMDGSLFDKEHLGLRFQLGELTSFINQVEGQIYYNYIDHVMDNYSLRPFVPSMMMKMPIASNPDRRTLGAKFKLSSTLMDNSTLQYGVDYQRNEHRNRTVMNAQMADFDDFNRVEDAEFRQTGVFAELEYRYKQNRQWIMGLRADDWKATDKRLFLSTMMGSTPNPTADKSKDDTLMSGFIRHQWQTEQTSFYAGLGHTERFPDYWELIGGGRASESGPNAFNVESEKTTQLDLGGVFKGEAWQGSASFFLNQADDYLLIDNNYEKMGKTTSAVRNIDTRSYGLELELQKQFGAAWQVASALSYVKGENRSDDVPLAQQPPLRLKTTITYQLYQWEFGALLDLAKGQHRVAIGQGNIAGQDVSETSGFGTVALNASYQIKTDTVLSFGVDNLFDKLYAEHLSRAGSAVSGYTQIDRINAAGRTLWANWDWRF